MERPAHPTPTLLRNKRVAADFDRANIMVRMRLVSFTVSYCFGKYVKQLHKIKTVNHQSVHHSMQMMEHSELAVVQVLDS